MGLVAGVASEASGVLCSDDLGKVFRLRAVCLVATGAEYCRIEFGGFYGSGIIRVLGQRSVAGFAIHLRMLTEVFLVKDVDMAGLAGLMAGEFNRPGRDFGHCISAVVPVLSKTFRDQETTDKQEYKETEHENPSQAEKMPCIFEDIHGTGQ
jgi:hypothetical protein